MPYDPDDLIQRNTQNLMSAVSSLPELQERKKVGGGRGRREGVERGGQHWDCRREGKRGERRGVLGTGRGGEAGAENAGGVSGAVRGMGQTRLPLTATL